jgi:hypothetical protein
VLLGVLGTPAAEITQTWAAVDAPSCAAVRPRRRAGTARAAPPSCWRGIGNENGLCESNETCLYTPNIGSYQGHGALVAGPSIGTIGSTSNVTLVKVANDGY